MCGVLSMPFSMSADSGCSLFIVVSYNIPFCLLFMSDRKMPWELVAIAVSICLLFSLNFNNVVKHCNSLYDYHSKHLFAAICVISSLPLFFFFLNKLGFFTPISAGSKTGPKRQTENIPYC